MAPSATIPSSSPSSTPQKTLLWVGLLAATSLSPASSSSSSSVALVYSAAAEAVATEAAASVAAWAKAISSRLEITAVEEHDAATVELVTAAVEADVPIGGGALCSCSLA